MLILDYPSDGESVYILPEANRAGAECEHIVFATLVGIPRSYGEAYDDAEGRFLLKASRFSRHSV